MNHGTLRRGKLSFGASALAFILGLACLPRAATAACGYPLMGSTNYDGPWSGQDEARAIAIDSTGNPVVAGFEANVMGDDDWRITVYDKSLGSVLHTATYNGPYGNGNDYAYAVAVDASGNIVVAGVELGVASDLNWRVRKYNPALSVMMASTDYDGPQASSADTAWGVAADPSGNIVVVGTEKSPSGGKQWRVQKYNPTLSTILSSTTYNGLGSGLNHAYAVAIDPIGGSVYVAGSYNAGASGQDWMVRKYDNTLSTVLAEFSRNGSGNLNDEASAIAIASNGDVVIAGYELGTSYGWQVYRTDSGLTNPPPYGATYALATTETKATAVALDYAGNVIVGGYEGNGGQDWRVIKYDPTLASMISSTKYGGAGNQSDYVRGVAVDSSGSIYVAGSEYATVSQINWRVRKYGGTQVCVEDQSAAPGPTAASLRSGQIRLAPNTLSASADGRIAIVLKGQPSGSPEVTVYDAADRVVDRFTVQLGGDGTAIQTWEAKYRSGGRLAPGVYWIRASGGGADDRKAFIVSPRRR